MVKRILAVLCLLAMALSCFACNAGSPGEGPNAVSTTTAPTYSTKDPVVAGSVRYVNPNPALQAAWETIAQNYTRQTGIKVQIIPAENAEGITPTLFTVENEKQLEAYADVCVDLASAKATHHVQNWSLTLYSGNKMCGLPLEAEGYGLIYNEDVLRQAGVLAADITSFAKLKEVVGNIAANPALEFEAFACVDLEDPVIGLLSALPGDIRPFWDLYANNSACGEAISEGDDPILKVANSEAAFCLTSTTKGEVLANMCDGMLNIMPLYIGMDNEDRQGLCVRVENYLCVRKDVPQVDIDATLDFLDYLTHPQDGKIPMDQLEVFTPYSTASYYASPLEKTLRDHISAAKNLLVFPDITAPAGFADTLQTYTTEPTDANWESVSQLLA